MRLLYRGLELFIHAGGLDRFSTYGPEEAYHNSHIICRVATEMAHGEAFFLVARSIVLGGVHAEALKSVLRSVQGAMY